MPKKVGDGSVETRFFRGRTDVNDPLGKLRCGERYLYR